ncbi:hypothetical protein [Daejeonella rubra]|uniref:hypothetical protein n=1 Tax=Daejeonella rubra TaxID=990371 RepID=UPI000B8288AA|nr:hypothetical protein [Daejeonella rubra]
MKAKRNKSPFFPTLKESFGQGSRRRPAAHKKQNTGCVLLKGKTMPFPFSHSPFFAFDLLLLGGKGMTPKIPFQFIARLKEINLPKKRLKSI